MWAYARAMCARIIINARMKYIWSIKVYFLSDTFQQINISIIDTRSQGNLKTFPFKKYDAKKIITMKKAKKTGGVAAKPSKFFSRLAVSIWLRALDRSSLNWHFILLLWMDISPQKNFTAYWSWGKSRFFTFSGGGFSCKLQII